MTWTRKKEITPSVSRINQNILKKVANSLKIAWDSVEKELESLVRLIKPIKSIYCRFKFHKFKILFWKIQTILKRHQSPIIFNFRWQ